MTCKKLLVVVVLLSVILGVDARSPRKTEKLYRKAGKWQRKLRDVWALLGVKPFLVQPGEAGDECVLKSKVDEDYVLKSTVEADACGAGTTLKDGKCTADILSCGAGTTLKDGECTPGPYVKEVSGSYAFQGQEAPWADFEGFKVLFEDKAAAGFTAKCCAAHRDAGEFYQCTSGHELFNTWVTFTSEDYDKCVTQLAGNEYTCSVDAMCLRDPPMEGACHLTFPYDERP